MIQQKDEWNQLFQERVNNDPQMVLCGTHNKAYQNTPLCNISLLLLLLFQNKLN